MVHEVDLREKVFLDCGPALELLDPKSAQSVTAIRSPFSHVALVVENSAFAVVI
jgi:ribosomal protein L22